MVRGFHDLLQLRRIQGCVAGKIISECWPDRRGLDIGDNTARLDKENLVALRIAQREMILQAGNQEQRVIAWRPGVMPACVNIRFLFFRGRQTRCGSIGIVKASDIAGLGTQTADLEIRFIIRRDALLHGECELALFAFVIHAVAVEALVNRVEGVAETTG